jgi:hypothetical protein
MFPLAGWALAGRVWAKEPVVVGPEGPADGVFSGCSRPSSLLPVSLDDAGGRAPSGKPAQAFPFPSHFQVLRTHVCDNSIISILLTCWSMSHFFII